MAVHPIIQLKDRLLYGPVTPYRGSDAKPVYEVAPQPIRTSWVFDSHVQEAQGSGKNVPQSISLAWDENEARGIDASMRTWQGITPRERKDILLGIYLANPWVSACVDVIAKRICSGGLSFEPLVEKPNEKNLETLENFCLRVNPEWDFLQFARASIIDELIFGETYTEIVLKDGVPYELYKVDCVTMTYRLDRYGHITRYEQYVDSQNEPNILDTDDIIRWWLPHPRAAMDPFSPIERVTDATLLDKKMVNWVTTFFQKGAKAPYYIKSDMDRDEAERFNEYYRQNYTGEKNAHMPPHAYQGAEFVEFKAGALEVDFPGGRDRNRTEILSAYHVPPAAVGIIESGNIGGGTGEDQEKSFQYNTCDPIRHAFFEKFNDRIVKKGFGITDYKVSTRYADYRSDDTLAKVQDTHIKNGSITIDEARAESGKKPYPDGAGAVPVIITPKEVTPVPRLKDLEDEQKQTAQQALDAGDLNNEMLKAKVEQAKNPPPVMPGQVPGQPPQPGKAAPSAGIVANQAKAKAKPAQKKQDTGESIHAETTQQATYPQGDARLTVFSQTQDAQTGTRTSRTIWDGTSSGNGLARNNDRREEETVLPDGDRGSQGGTTQGITSAVESEEHNTGMMLAFMLDEKTAKQLALPGGEKPEDMHVTLAYLGDMEDEIKDGDGQLRAHMAPERLITLLNDLTSVIEPPLEGVTGGIARFINADDDMTPVVATVNIPGLQMWRNFMTRQVERAGYFVASDFDFTPHITLAYIPKDAPMPIESLAPVPLSFDTICLCIGDERRYFKFGEGMRMPSEKYASSESVTQALTRASLAESVHTVFTSVQTRAVTQIEEGDTPELAYAFTPAESSQMTALLAQAYLTAKQAAHQKAATTVKAHVKIKPYQVQASEQAKAAHWAAEQVASITHTYHDKLTDFLSTLPEEAQSHDGQLSEGILSGIKQVVSQVGTWIADFLSWKVEQIVNVVWGSGTNEGTDEVIDEILDIATGPDAASLIDDLANGGLDAISVRCNPDSSSNDLCADYAGKTFTLAEYADLGVSFPAHPGCPHEWEVYTV